jgi:hypothetical protein
MVLRQLPLDDELRLVQAVKEWLIPRASSVPAYAAYLDGFGTWVNPRRTEEQATATAVEQ